jgi:hypothetical protein
MDPYLERHWGDIHQSFITYARDQLQTVLPGDLRARVQERVFVETPEAGRPMYPDIRVVERSSRKKAKSGGAIQVATAEPFRIRVYDEPVTEGFIEIIDVGSGRRVVTVVEVLSPSNKMPGPGFELFATKQRECHEGGVNVVEIDLLRAGRWVLSVPEHLVPPSHRTTYRICVYRPRADALGEIYRAPLRERLPAINIPLRESDADVPLDIQALIDQCYRNGGYDEDIDYDVEPVPPLDADDTRWADALLRQQGKRTSPPPGKPNRDGGRQRKRKS